MNTLAQDPNASRAKVEHVALERMVARLALRFPDFPVAEITGAVKREYERYANSRVRIYLTILVERAVRARLAAKTARRHAQASEAATLDKAR